MKKAYLTRAILLVDHGSRRPEANETLGDVANLLRQISEIEIVRFAHMELASPSIEEGVEACVKAGADEIIVHPYFLVPGRHSTGDIPRMVEDAARRFPGIRVVITEPLGIHPKICEVIMERIRDAEGKR